MTSARSSRERVMPYGETRISWTSRARKRFCESSLMWSASHEPNQSKSRPNHTTPLSVMSKPRRFSGRCFHATSPAARNDQPIARWTGSGKVRTPGSQIASAIA